MGNKIRWLPLSKGGNVCPICNKELNPFRPITIFINGRPYSCKVLQCKKCSLPFVDSEIVTSFKESTGLDLPVFEVSDKDYVTITRQQMYKPQLIENRATYKSQKNQGKSAIVPKRVDGFTLTDNNFSTWGRGNPKTLISISEVIVKCPVCNNGLEIEKTHIPYGKKYLKVPGRYCSRCRVLYIKESPFIEELLTDNKKAKGFTLNGVELWHKTKSEEEAACIQRLSQCKSAVILIKLQYDDGEQKDYVVIDDDKDVNISEGFIYYSSLRARELLTATFIESRHKKGSISGRSFTIVSHMKKHSRSNVDGLIPKEIVFKFDGGSVTSINNKDDELVDLLLYAPFTRRYEVIKATYNSEEKFYYIAPWRYREFVKQYGNPGLSLKTGNNSRGRKEFSEFNEKSVLKEFGYDVSEQTNLSSSERQELLADLVDMEIISISGIVSFLKFFIKSHPNHLNAQQKWEEDIRFISNYKANPSRFLIVQ